MFFFPEEAPEAGGVFAFVPGGGERMSVGTPSPSWSESSDRSSSWLSSARAYAPRLMIIAAALLRLLGGGPQIP